MAPCSRRAGIALARFGVSALSGIALPRVDDALGLLNSISYSLYIVFAKGTLTRFGRRQRAASSRRRTQRCGARDAAMTISPPDETGLY